jgi:hypothetical protein
MRFCSVKNIVDIKERRAIGVENNSVPNLTRERTCDWAAIELDVVVFGTGTQQ